MTNWSVHERCIVLDSIRCYHDRMGIYYDCKRCGYGGSMKLTSKMYDAPRCEDDPEAQYEEYYLNECDNCGNACKRHYCCKECYLVGKADYIMDQKK